MRIKIVKDFENLGQLVDQFKHDMKIDLVLMTKEQQNFYRTMLNVRRYPKWLKGARVRRNTFYTRLGLKIKSLRQEINYV